MKTALGVLALALAACTPFREQPEATDARADVRDVLDVRDAADVVDVTSVPDAPAVLDAPDAADAPPDAPDAADIFDAGSLADAVIDLGPPPDAGPCGMTCPFGTTCCGARCVDTDNSVLNCGGCGAQCSLSNATPQCNTGLCLIACATGFGDCDGDRSNGCETGLNTNRAHCGSCGNECPPENHARVFCFNRACQMGTCDPGWADCNGDIRDGCETHTDTDVNQCGACNRRCSAPTGRSPLCAAGVCGVTMACSPSNLADCDGVAANGCETDLNTALAHCGRCGNACGQANGAATCTAGGCAITCAANFGDCNASNADGCETDLRTSNANCSRCGLACALPDVSSQSCAGGACAVVGCANSRLDCDRNPLDGCEVSALTDRVNCGACGARCATGESCVGGRCLLAQTSCPSATEVGCGVEPINAGVLFTQGDNLALNAGPSLPLTTVGNFAIERWR